MSSKQIKITLPAKLQELLKFRADSFGLTMSSYVKHLIIEDTKNNRNPVRRVTKKVEEAYKYAMENKDRASIVKTPEELKKLFENL